MTLIRRIVTDLIRVDQSYPRYPWSIPLFLYQRIVSLRSPVAKELPNISNFANLVQIQSGNHQLVRIARRLSDYLAARVAEVALAVELTDVPGLLVADSIDCADEVAVGDCVCRLLELPQIFRKPRNCRRGVEHYLSAVQAECSRAFRKMTVVADVNSYSSKGGLKCRIAKIAGLEVVLLPEPGFGMRYVILAILSEVFAVGIDHCSGVVVNAGDLFFVDGHDNNHSVLFGHFLHQLDRWPIGYLLH